MGFRNKNSIQLIDCISISKCDALTKHKLFKNSELSTIIASSLGIVTRKITIAHKYDLPCHKISQRSVEKYINIQKVKPLNTSIKVNK